MAIRGDTTNQEQAWLLDMLPRRAGRVLEIGCGDGRLTRKYSAHADCVIGIDLPGALDADGMVSPCVASSAAQLPFRDSSFDGVIFALSF